MMNSSCISIIEKRFNSRNPQTYIVDVHANVEMNEIIAYFSVGDTTVISASDYCKNDELPCIANIYDVVSKKKGNILVTEIASFIRFSGERELRMQLLNILGLRTVGKVVFLTFCCAESLRFSDPRTKERIFISETAAQRLPELIFTCQDLPLPKTAFICRGMQSTANAIETGIFDKLYVLSKKRKSSYLSSVYSISDLNSSYDVLCQKDKITNSLDVSIGTEEQWLYALSLFDEKSCWEEVISFVFGNFKNLEYVLPNYENLDEKNKWLYFLAIKIFGISNNEYLSIVIASSNTQKDFIRQIFRTLLNVKETEENFEKLYSERKKLLKYFSEYNEEIEDYCKMSKLKSDKEIYYLTDLSLIEKESVFRFLDKYGINFEFNSLILILSTVYPDLNYYLSP